MWFLPSMALAGKGCERLFENANMAACYSSLSLGTDWTIAEAIDRPLKGSSTGTSRDSSFLCREYLMTPACIARRIIITGTPRFPDLKTGSRHPKHIPSPSKRHLIRMTLRETCKHHDSSSPMSCSSDNALESSLEPFDRVILGDLVRSANLGLAAPSPRHACPWPCPEFG